MKEMAMHTLFADILLVIHALFVAFVVLGFVLTVSGIPLRWSWVGNFWFRLVHLLAIGLVVTQAWFHRICPLTSWESSLREAAGGVPYSGSFISWWLQRLIYYDFAPWVFTGAYTIFAAMVLVTWILSPPRFPSVKGSA
jgi:hypothetical protein